MDTHQGYPLSRRRTFTGNPDLCRIHRYRAERTFNATGSITTMSNLPPAAWYQDPEDSSQLRYWDGRQWTEHRAPREHAAPGSSSTPSVKPGADVMPAQTFPSATSGEGAPQSAEPLPAKSSTKVPLFGARKHAQQTADELDRLRGEMQRLGVLDVAELQRERAELQAQVAQQRAAFEQERSSLGRAIGRPAAHRRAHPGGRDPPGGRYLRVPTPPRRLRSPTRANCPGCRTGSRHWPSRRVAQSAAPRSGRSTARPRRAARWSKTSPS